MTWPGVQLVVHDLKELPWTRCCSAPMHIRIKVLDEFLKGLSAFAVVIHGILNGHPGIGPREHAREYRDRHPVRQFLHLDGIFKPEYSFLESILGFWALERKGVPIRTFWRKHPLP